MEGSCMSARVVSETAECFQSVRNIFPRGKYYTYKQNKLRGLSPQANYTDRATAACRRS
jgi:hypothetical protein